MNSVESTPVLLFVDVSGSATLYERLSATEAEHAIDRCIKRIRRSIEGFEGQARQVVGDEILALFHSSEAACLAAIDMQQRIADLPPASGHKLAIRIGIHRGDCGDDGQELTGEAVIATARIAGLANPSHILASEQVMAGLPEHGSVRGVAKPPPLHGQPLPKLFDIVWSAQGRSAPAETAAASPTGERMVIRYRDHILQADTQTPMLTLGRDPANKLVIEDRKASRQHARIERRENGFFLIDTSTNGTFVSIEGQRETLLRRHELQLEGRGRICFGSSGNDPSSDCADFELR